MKALLLSSGIGTRLGNKTKNTPKVMIKINGKPCLQYHIENLKKQGITEFLINTHYFPEKIKEYFGNGERFGVNIQYSFEKELLGTSGAINNFKDKINDSFIVVYTDVLANFNLKEALKIHQSNKNFATIILDSNRDMIGKGAVRIKENKAIEFIEKPKEKIKNALINSGFYIFEKEIINYIPPGFSDFGHDILPKLAKEEKINFYKHDGYIFDIGTEEDLEKANNYLINLDAKNKSKK